MYKTVRKGDASLQYTILPQTDQFSSGGLSQISGKPRPRMIRYTMGALMVMIILSCVATPFLMNQNDHNLFATTVLGMGRIGHSTDLRSSLSTRNQTKESRSGVSTATMAATEVSRRNDLVEETTSISLDVPRDDEQESIEEATSADTLNVPNSVVVLATTVTTSTVTPTTSSTSTTGAQRTHVPMYSSTTSTRQTSSASTLSTTTSAATSSTVLKLSSSTLTESTKPGSSVSRKGKMPRVTLKLRENETIPQMYMKAGIASYKKGNITTSVLAHGLSLEGLIFKTPEGTIKPWPQKWFFTDPSSDFQWKGSNQMPVSIYIVLAGLAALASISIVLMFYVQRKASRRQRQCIEEPGVEGHEEDKSTLLGADTQETEEKE